MHTEFVWTEFAKIRERELLREAESRQLLKEARMQRSGLHNRLLLRLGAVLIALGLWLQERSRLDDASRLSEASQNCRV